MQHRTITLDEHGALGCTCGEDHGPSLREELDWALAEVTRLRVELVKRTDERDDFARKLRLALRRIQILRKG
jgi:hypothetical protein